MKPATETIEQFTQSLDLRRRRFLFRREDDLQTRLQKGLRDLRHGLSEVSALSGAASAIALPQRTVYPRQ